MSLENPVRTLNVEVARKIAAGEVIDRPNDDHYPGSSAPLSSAQ